MYDYIRKLGDSITDEQLTAVFGNIALLNEQPFCKDWVPLIAAVGVEGMLGLSHQFGGQSFTVPPFYHVLLVYAALMVIELEKSYSYEEAKNQVIGGLVLDGFDELVDKIRTTSTSLTSSGSEEII